MSYEVIYADPPWMETGGGKSKRGADKHYPLMKTSDIIALGSDVQRVAEDDSLLFLWVTNSFLPDGLSVMAAWGYRYVTNLAWVKPRFGLGFYLRGQHELLLFGVRGKPERSRQEASRAGRYIPPSVLSAGTTEHSAKPQALYGMIELMSEGPYLEMFARKRRPGWDAWGNEVTETTEATLWEL